MRPSIQISPVRDPLEPAFTRGQAEWALWRLDFSNEKRTPTTRFKIQVKHLLELDRSEPLASRSISHAFSDEPTFGRGEHSLFSAFDTFMLETGLSLLTIGFKRKDVVLFLRARRNRWRRIAPILKTRLEAAAKELTRSHLRARVDTYEQVKLQIPAIDAPPTKSDDHLRLASDFGEVMTSDRGRLIILDMGFAAHHLPFLLLTAPLRRRGPS